MASLVGGCSTFLSHVVVPTIDKEMKSDVDYSEEHKALLIVVLYTLYIL